MPIWRDFSSYRPDQAIYPPIPATPNAAQINTICHGDMVSDSSRTGGGTTLNSTIATVAMIADCTTGDNALKRARAEGGLSGSGGDVGWGADIGRA